MATPPSRHRSPLKLPKSHRSLLGSSSTLGQEQVGRDGLGRFRKGRSGNPRGRALGSRNRAAEIAGTMLEGEGSAVARKPARRALTGNSAAMRLSFGRVVPPRRERPVRGLGC